MSPKNVFLSHIFPPHPEWITAQRTAGGKRSLTGWTWGSPKSTGQTKTRPLGYFEDAAPTDTAELL